MFSLAGALLVTLKTSVENKVIIQCSQTPFLMTIAFSALFALFVVMSLMFHYTAEIASALSAEDRVQ